MKPRDAFGVIVRAAGLGFFIAGVLDLGHLAIEYLGLPIHSGYQPALVLTAAGFWIVLGLALLAGAPLIVRLIYGQNDSG
jgi:hypothetical protein